MNNEKLNENIGILEKGITLHQFSEMQDQLEIDGSLDAYNEYGMYVVHNKTQNVYLIDGGNSPSAFPMSTSIPQFFLSHNGYGNPYMNQHYANGDEMILKFYRFDPQKYNNMGEMESALTKYYDSIAENYYDYVLRMNGRPIEKGERKPGYNKYYNGAAKAPIINNSLPSNLLRLEHNHKRTYEFLNAVFDILIKSLPIFIWMLVTNRDLFYGENVIQKGIMFITGIIAAFIGGILGYLFILLMIQLFKLFFCTYKKVNIHLRIFDVIIKLGKKKLYTSEDMDFLDEHEYSTQVRKDKVYDGKDRAYQKQQQRDEDALKYRKEQFEREKRDAEYYRDRAEAGYKDARNGDGFFTTAEEKRKNAGKDLDTATWHAQQASYEEQKIADLERKLGK